MNVIQKETKLRREDLKKYQKDYRLKQSVPESKARRKRNRCNIHLKAMNEAIFEDYFSFIGKDLNDGLD